jgi:hypothetical protein
MTADDQLVGIGISFITVAAVLFLAVNGSIDAYALRLDALRLQGELASLLSQVAGLLPL